MFKCLTCEENHPHSNSEARRWKDSDVDLTNCPSLADLADQPLNNRPNEGSMKVLEGVNRSGALFKRRTRTKL